MKSQNNISNIVAPIYLGELIDKITILEIKKEHMSGFKLKNVEKELELLRNIIQNKKLEIEIDLFNSLRKVNNSLWHIEDRIRVKESCQEFDKEFIQLARSVYKENDRRAFIKKEINLKYNSELTEEKLYKK